MHRIQRVSSYLIWIFNFLLFLFPLCLILEWTLLQTTFFKNLNTQIIIFEPIKTPEGMVTLNQLHFTPLSWSIGFLSGLLNVVPWCLGLIILKHLFKNYRMGIIFSFENVQKYKYLGWLFFLDALFISPISGMLRILMATLSNPPGHRHINIVFGTPTLETILYGLLVLIISWVMAEGYKLHEDQSLTV